MKSREELAHAYICASIAGSNQWSTVDALATVDSVQNACKVRWPNDYACPPEPADNPPTDKCRKCLATLATRTEILRGDCGNHSPEPAAEPQGAAPERPEIINDIHIAAVEDGMSEVSAHDCREIINYCEKLERLTQGRTR